MKTRRLLLIIIIVLGSFSLSFSQGETAVPFLLITSSPEGNGMGGINASRLSEDAMAPIANPAQLGLISLDHYLTSSIYTEKTQWLPLFRQPDQTYNTTAVNIGLNLTRITPLPVPLSIGIGYSRIFLNLGTFVLTGGGGPGPLGTYEATEKSENYAVGVGVDYFGKLGLGLTSKQIESILFPFEVQGTGRKGIARVSTIDLGLIAQAPVFGIISKIQELPMLVFPNVEPIFDITFGYARSNLGDKSVVYIDASQADPLPRKATMGLSWKAGLVSHATSHDWEVISFTLAREAEDVLVTRFPAPVDSFGNVTGDLPPFQYQDGVGDIEFFKNVILGEGNTKVGLRKGWQVNLGEFVTIRGGSYTGPDRVEYTTSGIGLRLRGIFRCIESLSPSIVSVPAFDFISNHFDLQYSHSDYTPAELNHPLTGTSFQGLNLILQ